MSLISRFKWLTRTLIAVAFALLFALATTISAFASVSLLQLSSDTFTNPDSQHATEVEPDTFAFGSTIVSAFQVGRFFNGGASDIGFATSSSSDPEKNGPLASCLAPRSTQHRRDHICVPVMPQWPSTPSTRPGSSPTWVLRIQAVLSMWMSAARPMGD